MTTHEGKLLKNSIILALALVVLAPLTSFAGSWGFRVNLGIAAPGPGYVWVPGYNEGYGWVPAHWALPPFAGAFWVTPRWSWNGHQRYLVNGYWGRGGYSHRDGYYQDNGYSRGQGDGYYRSGGYSEGRGDEGSRYRRDRDDRGDRGGHSGRDNRGGHHDEGWRPH
ncbi:MAG: hypothetical protein M3O15_14535 [Acidobacteriota bacterium]|nr:hypothetical protein [Acidobacteriota bacterium]